MFLVWFILYLFVYVVVNIHKTNFVKGLVTDYTIQIDACYRGSCIWLPN